MSNKAVCRPKDKRKDEILRGYEYQIEKAESLEREIERLMTKATKMTSVITDMPRGGAGMDMGDKIIEWLPLQEQIRAEIEESVRIRAEIMRYLDSVKIAKLRTVLQLTYIECITQEEIAEKMHYCTRQIQRLQDQALELIKV